MGLNQHKDTGKALIHHTVNNVCPAIATDICKVHIDLFPDVLNLKDKKGAVPMHWAVLNKQPSLDAIDLLIKSHPPGPATKDADGFLPLHWAVNKDPANISVVKKLLSAYPVAAQVRLTFQFYSSRCQNSISH